MEQPNEDEQMSAAQPHLKRNEILALACQAKLMIEDGNVRCMNDMATEKELLVFVRLLESALSSAA